MKKAASNGPIFLTFFLIGLASGGLLAAVFLLPHPPTTGARLAAALQTGPALTERTVPIAAVDPAGHAGLMGNLTVRLVPGEGNILLDTDPFTEPDVQQSAQIAAQVAQQKAGVQLSSSDIVFSYSMPNKVDVVGGASAGAAATIAAIAALENRTIKPGVAMTGTINPDGTIGNVGGVLEKAKAAADAGYKVFLVPEGEAGVTTYERTTRRWSSRGFTRYHSYYTPNDTDLQKAAAQWNLTIKEVGTIDDAMKEMIS